MSKYNSANVPDAFQFDRMRAFESTLLLHLSNSVHDLLLLLSN